MKFPFFFGVLAIASIGFANESDSGGISTKSEIENTLACHRSVKALGSHFYEVFEKPAGKDGKNLSYVRTDTTIQDGELGERGALRFTLTDGKDVFVVNDPYPMKTGLKNPNDPKSGETIERKYWIDHNFRMDIPYPDGKKSYCFSYVANSLLNDETKRFEETPPASCKDYPVRTAARKEGAGAAQSLQDLHFRIQQTLNDAMAIADKYKNKGAVSDETKDVIAALGKFDPSACKKIQSPRDSLRKTLANFEKKQSFYKNPTAIGTDGGGTGQKGRD